MNSWQLPLRPAGRRLPLLLRCCCSLATRPPRRARVDPPSCLPPLLHLAAVPARGSSPLPYDPFEMSEAERSGLGIGTLKELKVGGGEKRPRAGMGWVGWEGG